jgi:hypothetical protein
MGGEVLPLHLERGAAWGKTIEVIDKKGVRNENRSFSA